MILTGDKSDCHRELENKGSKLNKNRKWIQNVTELCCLFASFWQLVLMHGFWNGCELISACSPVAVQNGPQAIRKCLGAPKRLPTCDWDYYFLSCRNLFSPWWHSTAIKRPHCEGQVQACAILLGNTCTRTLISWWKRGEESFSSVYHLTWTASSRVSIPPVSL